MLNWLHLLDGMISMHHQDSFATHAFPAQGLSAMLVSPGKDTCRHHRFARALAHCHCRQWVPGQLIGQTPCGYGRVCWSDSGWGHLDLKFYNKTPFLLWIVKNNGFLIIKYLWFVNFKYVFKEITKFRKNSSFNWFTPFHVSIHPSIVSRPFHRDTHQFTV